MANPVTFDRVLETTTTTGTGTLTLAGAVTGYQSFAVVGNGNTCPYTIWGVAANGNPSGAWETGIGTYTASGTTLARTTVLESSNSNAAVNFGSGTKRVALAHLAQFTPQLRSANTWTVGPQTINPETINTKGIVINGLLGHVENLFEVNNPDPLYGNVYINAYGDIFSDDGHGNTSFLGQSSINATTEDGALATMGWFLAGYTFGWKMQYLSPAYDNELGLTGECLTLSYYDGIDGDYGWHHHAIISTDGSWHIGPQHDADFITAAKFQIDSTTQGFLPPRLTTTQRDAVSSPPEGLLVFNTTTHALNQYNGSSWGALGTSYTADESTLHLSGTTFSIKNTAYVAAAASLAMGLVAL